MISFSYSHRYRLPVSGFLIDGTIPFCCVNIFTLISKSYSSDLSVSLTLCQFTDAFAELIGKTSVKASRAYK